MVAGALNLNFYTGLKVSSLCCIQKCVQHLTKLILIVHKKYLTIVSVICEPKLQFASQKVTRKYVT